MVTVLTNEHYNTILNFSRKITNGKNSDDLSQHVILNVLQKDNDFIKGLIDNREINRYLWTLVRLEYIQGNSSYNRIEHEIHGRDNRVEKISFDKWYYKYEQDHSDEHDRDTCSNWLTGLDGFYTKDDDEEIDIDELIKKAKLTDVERMYLNAYMDSNYNYKQCSRDLDISEQTISKYVKQAIKKCRESL